MKIQSKKLLSVFLALAMVFSLAVPSALAESGSVSDSDLADDAAVSDSDTSSDTTVSDSDTDTDTDTNTCGDNLTWTLVDGVLTISGTGDMEDYSWGDAPWYDYNGDITSVVIEDGVTSIGDRAFFDCWNSTSVSIPSSVTSIGDYAFCGCSSVTIVYYNGTTDEWNAINIGSNNTCVTNPIVNSIVDVLTGTCGENVTWALNADGVLTISGTGDMYDYDYAYSLIIYTTSPWDECSDIILSVVIEDGVTSIGSWAFISCNYLKNTTIPCSITDIGDNAFTYCTSLTSVTIPDSVTSIGDFAFDGCSSLASVTIGNNMMSIGDYAFRNCTSLTSVTISDSVTSIGECAFYICDSLTDVYYTGTEEEWAAITIEDYNDPLLNATIHCNYVVSTSDDDDSDTVSDSDVPADDDSGTVSNSDTPADNTGDNSGDSTIITPITPGTDDSDDSDNDDSADIITPITPTAADDSGDATTTTTTTAADDSSNATTTTTTTASGETTTTTTATTSDSPATGDDFSAAPLVCLMFFSLIAGAVALSFERRRLYKFD